MTTSSAVNKRLAKWNRNIIPPNTKTRWNTSKSFAKTESCGCCVTTCDVTIWLATRKCSLVWTTATTGLAVLSCFNYWMDQCCWLHGQKTRWVTQIRMPQVPGGVGGCQPIEMGALIFWATCQWSPQNMYAPCYHQFAAKIVLPLWFCVLYLVRLMFKHLTSLILMLPITIPFPCFNFTYTHETCSITLGHRS